MDKSDNTRTPKPRRNKDRKAVEQRSEPAEHGSQDQGVHYKQVLENFSAYVALYGARKVLQDLGEGPAADIYWAMQI